MLAVISARFAGTSQNLIETMEVKMANSQRGGSSEQHAKAGGQSRGGQGKSGGGSSGGSSRSEAARKGGESHSKEHMSEIGRKGGKK